MGRQAQAKRTKQLQNAYQISGESRPGRWLVTCDHASNHVPDWVGGGSLGIGPADMSRHIAYDVGAAGLARALAEALDSPVIESCFSRLVIDANRGAAGKPQRRRPADAVAAAGDQRDFSGKIQS